MFLLDIFSNFFFSDNKSIVMPTELNINQQRQSFIWKHSLSVWYRVASLKASQKMKCPKCFCQHGPLCLVGLWESSGTSVPLKVKRIHFIQLLISSWFCWAADTKRCDPPSLGHVSFAARLTADPRQVNTLECFQSLPWRQTSSRFFRSA